MHQPAFPIMIGPFGLGDLAVHEPTAQSDDDPDAMGEVTGRSMK
jgi:hypothetical protein